MPGWRAPPPPPPLPLIDVLTAARAEQTGTPQPERYNVIVFLSDALRASNLSLHGYRRETTPNLVAFASQGIRFDQHHSNYPATVMSISQLHTGRLRPPLMMGNSPVRYPTRAIEPDLFVLPQWFQQAGYETSIATGHPWFDEDARLLRWFDDQHLMAPVDGAAYATAETVVAEARTFLDGHDAGSGPFCQYVHVMDTHQPNQLRPDFAAEDISHWIPDGYAEYDSEIAYMDHWFGEMLRMLAASGRLSDTIVVFTADHGEEFGEQGPGEWNTKHGKTLRRALLHIPLIMWLPQDPQPGRVIGDLTRHVDVAPTLASLAGPTLDLGNTRVDGIDLSPALLAPGSGVGGAGESLSFADRYWALHSREQSAHHDNWHDTAVALDLSVDRWNYESGVAIESDGAAETLLTRLEQQRVQQKASWDSLPSRSDPADHAMLAFAGAVDSERDPPPTYSDSKLDHRWGQLGGYLLCHPSEQCGGLSTSFPWTPGRYHLSLRFDPSRVEGFRNEVTLAVLGTGLDPLRVKGNEESVYVGELDLGDPLSLRLSDPLGGVALTGIELTRVGAEDQALGDHGEPTMDPHQLEQLRALGYIN